MLMLVCMCPCYMSYTLIMVNISWQIGPRFPNQTQMNVKPQNEEVLLLFLVLCLVQYLAAHVVC